MQLQMSTAYFQQTFRQPPASLASYSDVPIAHLRLETAQRVYPNPASNSGSVHDERGREMNLARQSKGMEIMVTEIFFYVKRHAQSVISVSRPIEIFGVWYHPSH